MRHLLAILLFVSLNGYSQCKTYRIGVKGDTLNCIDNHDKKQGKWIIRTESLRGEPGFEEEGQYKDDKKEGTWRKYNLMGDVLSVENYRWGYKNGTSRYFSLAGLQREENWKAVDPENPYDTIEVPDLDDPYKVEMKVIKLEGTSVKHGEWKYYDASTGAIEKTENYFLDKLEDPNKKLQQAVANKDVPDSSATSEKTAASKKKPQEVLQYEKKNSKKKKINVRDGQTGY